MLISHSKKFIYIRSQKTASCSLQSFLSHACNGNDYLYVKTGKLSKLEGYNSKVNIVYGEHHEDHANLNFIKDNFSREYKDYKLITSVRNPWDLEFSRYKYINRDREECKDIKKFEKWIVEERYLISRYDVEQYIFDSDGNCPIDYFLRIEQITTDVEDVIKKLNL